MQNTVVRRLAPWLLLWQTGCQDTSVADSTVPTITLPAPNDSPAGSTNLECATDRETPALAPSLDPRSLSAVDLLLGPYAYVVGTRCGFVGIETREWLAMRELLHAGNHEALHRVASSAATREGRVLGITGLYHAGEIDEHRARAMLSQLHGDVQTCGGCIYSTAPADSMLGFVLSAGPRTRD